MGEVWRNAGKASEIAPRRSQWSERGFGVKLGEVPSPRLSLSRLVFAANWMVALIMSVFGSQFSNISSFTGPDLNIQEEVRMFTLE